MEQGWLYPEEHDKFPKGFGESVPMSVQKHFREPASKFNDKNVSWTLSINASQEQLVNIFILKTDEKKVYRTID